MFNEMDLNTIKALVEEVIEDLVQNLSQDKRISIEESLDMVYNSMVYKSLCDQDTNLYSKGSSFVYELLKNEIS